METTVTRALAAAGALVLVLVPGALTPAAAQPGAGTPSPPRAAQAEPPRDTLGRDTPRGTLLGFMNAGRSGNQEVAPLYLNTNLRNKSAGDLAHQLYVVLDSRLHARVTEVSDRPEGSKINPLKPDEEVIGRVDTSSGPLEIVLERVNRGTLGPVWMFSRRTLESVPDVFAEVDLIRIDHRLPAFLTQPRIAGVRLLAWLVLVLALPILYKLTGALGFLFRPIVTRLRRRGQPGAWSPGDVPGPVRLIVLALFIRWMITSVEIPFIERQFWTVVGRLLATAAFAWLLLLFNGWGEGVLVRRFQGSAGGTASLLRLGRRVADAFVVAIGVLVVLHYFGVDPTAALAGLGIGGIAVALAAQKTLENVIGGLSIIFDKAVQVGDSVKLGDTVGTVDYIGLRSTRIRTLDRTILSVPNGQIANVNIETLSARDKFWFHHFVTLRYETTSAQMRTVIESMRALLSGHPDIDPQIVRVRFVRLGPSSIDIEVFAYIVARDWNHFLEIQQDLLLRIIEIVEESGTTIAYPSQTLHFADAPDAAGSRRLAAALPADRARALQALEK